MTVPTLGQDDLVLLAQVYPDLRFDNDERRAVLLESGTRDVNAAPGSGKTTLLGAKLYLLSRRWTLDRQGICVISHTNVARDEIQRRLLSTIEGAKLLAYPHFVGTIHAFVNQFLALPWLRSQGIAVDMIDNEVFADRALRRARRNWTVRAWMDRIHTAPSAVATMQMEGAELDIRSAEGRLPGPDSRSGEALRQIKLDLMLEGFFRFEDMFAFAETLLRDHPYLSERMARRFPMVFVDEMQDTSPVQEALLERLFGDGVVIQRLGDVNQNILSGGGETNFPKEGYLSIRTSKRFGAGIARAVSSVQLDGVPVIGEGVAYGVRPMLLLYSSQRVQEVIPHFGEMVLARIADDTLREGKVRALCMRKQGQGAVEPGRHLDDYWPSFGGRGAVAGSGQDRLVTLMADRRLGLGGSFDLLTRVTDIRRAMLLVLRDAGSPHIDGIREAKGLIRALARRGLHVDWASRLCRDLTMDRGLVIRGALADGVIDRMHVGLFDLLPDEMTLEQFRELDVFSRDLMEAAPQAREPNMCLVEFGGRNLRIAIGTTASMKGETHAASLVLESYGGQSRRFDLADAVPVLSGVEAIAVGMSALRKNQYRNLYVAMSRPTHFLCLAMNAMRASNLHVDALVAAGWDVERIV